MEDYLSYRIFRMVIEQYGTTDMTLGVQIVLMRSFVCIRDVF